jgi:hypothetical protein
MDLWMGKTARSVLAHSSSYPKIQSSSFFLVAGSRESNKKPTTVSSRGFLSKFHLSTSANGVVSYDDDYQGDLSNIV